MQYKNEKFDTLFREYFWTKQKNKEVYAWLNEDNGSIVSYNGSFWIELSWRGANYPNKKAFYSKN